MRAFSGVILEQASLLVTALKSLDYQRIAAHYPDDVTKLRAVLAELDINFTIYPGPSDNDEGLNSYASKANVTNSDPRKPSIEATTNNKGTGQIPPHKRQQQILDQLSTEGFSERVGQVYSSFANSRVLAFNKVPHRRGLPNYDIVMAPDFAPVSGMHGIFISATEIMSVILPAASPDSDWQLIKSKHYKDESEMIEFLTLIAAGFDLP